MAITTEKCQPESAASKPMTAQPDNGAAGKAAQVSAPLSGPSGNAGYPALQKSKKANRAARDGRQKQRRPDEAQQQRQPPPPPPQQQQQPLPPPQQHQQPPPPPQHGLQPQAAAAVPEGIPKWRLHFGQFYELLEVPSAEDSSLFHLTDIWWTTLDHEYRTKLHKAWVKPTAIPQPFGGPLLWDNLCCANNPVTPTANPSTGAKNL